MNRINKPFLLLFSIILLASSSCNGQGNSKQTPRHINGFELSNLLIPSKEIMHGGPPRDGIPSIEYPKFAKAEAANFMKEQEYVLGIFHNGIAKAYPIRIMNYHEIVNDMFGEGAVAITYCPLCGSGVAVDATIEGAKYKFGVSGLLYNSDVLMYDRSTGSLWSQIMGKAVAGPQSGTQLKYLPTDYTTWAEWKTRYPETLVLTMDTGFNRDYNKTPYKGYESNPNLMFSVNHTSSKLRQKERVLGVEVNGAFKAYPLRKLRKGPAIKEDQLNGKTLKVFYDVQADAARIQDIDGNEIPAITLFWFAWYAFHPDTEIYK